MKNNINTKIGATLLSAAILAGTAVIPMTNAAALDASAMAATRAAKPSMKISAHVQDLGWMDPVEAKEGNVVGTFWQSRRVEAMKFDLRNCPDVTLNIRAHIQDYGDRDFIVTAADYDKLVGTQWESKRMEAVTITSNGLHEKGYKLQYRAHVQDYGWLDWVEEGQMGGTRWESKRVEAIETRIVPIEEKVNVETKLDYIKTVKGTTNIAFTLNSDPTNYHYTLVGNSNNPQPSIGKATINTKTNQVVLPATGLVDEAEYTLTVKDVNNNEIKKEIFTYRSLSGVDEVKFEGTGINAKNVNELVATVKATGTEKVDRMVEVTLKEVTDDDSGKKVKLYGTIGATLVDTKIQGDVSALADGEIEVSTKVYDKEGNVTEYESSLVTTTPGTLRKGVEPSKVVIESSERASYTSANIGLKEIVTDNGIKLSKVHYAVVEQGAKAPTAEEIVAGTTKANGTATVTISATGLEQNKAYTVYMVTENNAGTLSDIITVPVARDIIADRLKVVTDIKSNGDGTFTWKDDQAKTTEYIVQLVKGSGKVVASKTVRSKNVDFSEVIREQEEETKYTVDVVAVGDYSTIRNSSKASGSSYLTVTQLQEPGITAKVMNASTIRLTFDSLTATQQKGNNYKVVVTKAVIVDDKTEYQEVYTSNENLNVNWLDLNTTNYADGAYKIAVSITKGSDITLLDSEPAVKTYAKVTNKVTNYEVEELTNSSIKVNFAPVKVDGIADPSYTVKVEALDASTGTWSVKSLTTNITNKANTGLKTLTISGATANTTYKVSITPDYTSTSANIKHIDADELTTSIEATTKSEPIKNISVEVVDGVPTSGKISIVDGVLKMHDGTAVKELKGSNLEEIKTLVSRLSAGDTFTVDGNGKVTVVGIKPLSDSTKVVYLEDYAKGANVTVTNSSAQQVTVIGNIGSGSLTLSGTGKFNIEAITLDAGKKVTTNAAAKIVASAGTTITLTTGCEINGVTFTASNACDVKVTGNNEITIPESTTAITAIAASDNETIVFEGTHAETTSINANGNNNTITIKTNKDSSINGLTVVGGKVDIVDAYLRAMPTITTAGTIITDTVFTAENLTVTPVSGNVTITKASSKNYTVSGNATVEYAKAAMATAIPVKEKEDLHKDGPVTVGDYKFSTNNIATYTTTSTENSGDTPTFDVSIKITLTFGEISVVANN